jgi:CrcB protein
MPTDPDLTAADSSQTVVRDGLVRGRGDVVAVIAAGGAIGSSARYALAQLLPHLPGQVAWSTVIANLTGAFLLGLLMVFVNDVWRPNRYVRPFLGVGVLGGYTTFSTYMLDAYSLVQAGHIGSLAGYVILTLVGGLLAVALGAVTGRLVGRVGRLRWTR